MKRSQAALEFLSTYAWAFIAIVVAMGALYYSGIIDFGKYIPEKCVFPLQFKCVDYSLQPNSIRLKLINNVGNPVVINTVQATSDDSNPLTCANVGCNGGIPGSCGGLNWIDSQELELYFTGCSGGLYIPGERVTAKFEMTFAAAYTGAPTHQIVGKISGKVIK